MDSIDWKMRLGNAAPSEMDTYLDRLKKTCTRSDAIITLPKDNAGVAKIKLATSQGGARIEWKSPHTLANDISIQATNGSVILEGLSVKNRTEISVLGTGMVQGVLNTAEYVTVSTEIGWIDLEIDTEMGLIGNNPSFLDVTLKTTEIGWINVVHVRISQVLCRRNVA
jgi:hypothetical protein